MPKFLDAPIWYDSNGTLMKGMGYNSSIQWTNGSMPVYNSASGDGFSTRSININGSASSNKSIYVNESSGEQGQIPLSNGSGALGWADIYFNGSRPTTSSSTDIYAPTVSPSSHQDAVLRVAYNGSGIGYSTITDTSYFVHNIQLYAVGNMWIDTTSSTNAVIFSSFSFLTSQNTEITTAEQLRTALYSWLNRTTIPATGAVYNADFEIQYLITGVHSQAGTSAASRIIFTIAYNVNRSATITWNTADVDVILEDSIYAPFSAVTLGSATDFMK